MSISSGKLFQSDIKIKKKNTQGSTEGIYSVSHLPVNKYNQREHAFNIFGDKLLLDLKCCICCVK